MRSRMIPPHCPLSHIRLNMLTGEVVVLHLTVQSQRPFLYHLPIPLILFKLISIWYSFNLCRFSNVMPHFPSGYCFMANALLGTSIQNTTPKCRPTVKRFSISMPLEDFLRVRNSRHYSLSSLV